MGHITTLSQEWLEEVRLAKLVPHLRAPVSPSLSRITRLVLLSFRIIGRPGRIPRTRLLLALRQALLQAHRRAVLLTRRWLREGESIPTCIRGPQGSEIQDSIVPVGTRIALEQDIQVLSTGTGST